MNAAELAIFAIVITVIVAVGVWFMGCGAPGDSGHQRSEVGVPSGGITFDVAWCHSPDVGPWDPRCEVDGGL